MKRFHKLALVPAAIAATLAGNAQAGTTACFEVYKADQVQSHDVLYRNDSCVGNSRTTATATTLQGSTAANVAYEITKDFGYDLEIPSYLSRTEALADVASPSNPVVGYDRDEIQIVYIPTTNMGSRDRVTFALSGPANWGKGNANQMHLFMIDEADNGSGLVYKEVATSDGIFNDKQEITFVFKAGVTVRAGQRLVWSRDVSADGNAFDSSNPQDDDIVSPKIQIQTEATCADDVEDVVLTAVSAVTDGGNPIIGAADVAVKLVDIKPQFAITAGKRGVTKAQVNSTVIKHEMMADGDFDTDQAGSFDAEGSYSFDDAESHINGQYMVYPMSRFVKTSVHDNVVWTETYVNDTNTRQVWQAVANNGSSDENNNPLAGDDVDETHDGFRTQVGNAYASDYEQHSYGLGAVYAFGLSNQAANLDASIELNADDKFSIRYKAEGNASNVVVGLFDRWDGRYGTDLIGNNYTSTHDADNDNGVIRPSFKQDAGFAWSTPAGTTDITYSALEIFNTTADGDNDGYIEDTRGTKYIALAHAAVGNTFEVNGLGGYDIRAWDGVDGASLPMGYNYNVSFSATLELDTRVGISLHNIGTCEDIMTHEITFNGAVLKAPYVFTSGAGNFVRLTNESASAAAVYADVFGEDGKEIKNVMVGTIPARASKVFFAADLIKAANAAGYTGTGSRQSFIFNVMADKEHVNGVSVQTIPGGVDRVMPVLDANNFSQ
jgi:hypothetical protein